MLSTLHAAERRGLRFTCRVCQGPAQLVGARRVCQVDNLHGDPLGDVAAAVAEMEDRRTLLDFRRQARSVTPLERCIEQMDALRVRLGRA